MKHTTLQVQCIIQSKESYSLYIIPNEVLGKTPRFSPPLSSTIEGIVHQRCLYSPSH